MPCGRLSCGGRRARVEPSGELPADYDFEAHKQLVPMQPGDVPVSYADATALERDFGYKPATPFEDGLRVVCYVVLRVLRLLIDFA